MSTHYLIEIKHLSDARIDELVRVLENAILEAHAAGTIETVDEREARTLVAALSNRERAADER